jgi:hypothetical protein
MGEDTWRDGLDRLIDALKAEARLNDVGVQVAMGEILMYLSNRLGIVDWHARHPELTRADVVPPIVIVGQGRTGTTILHDVLAQDPANRVPLTWEVDKPLPPPESATYETDPRIDESQQQLDMTELVIPGFKTMHPIGARHAQECVRMSTGSTCRSCSRGTTARAGCSSRRDTCGACPTCSPSTQTRCSCRRTATRCASSRRSRR